MSAAAASEPAPQQASDIYTLIALQLRATLNRQELATVVYHALLLDEGAVEDYRKRGLGVLAADRGRHGPVRTDVCGMCGRPLSGRT